MRKLILFLVLLGGLGIQLKAQTTDDVLNLLIQKNIVSQKDADSIRAEAAIAAQASQAKVKTFPVSAGKKIQLSGFTQIRYQSFSETDKIDGFDVRRARFDVKGLISPFWSYRVQFELAGTPKLIDAYAELKVNDFFNVLAGQAKIPLSLESNISVNKLELIDWSLVDEALVGRGRDISGNQLGRDIGIQFSGIILKRNFNSLLDYRVGVFNGNGINTFDNNNYKDISGRLVAHPIVGLDLGTSFYNGMRFVPEIKEVKTNGVVTIAASPAKSVVRDRYGFDLNYIVKNLLFRGEYIHGTDNQTKRDGYYFMVGNFFFQKKLQVLAKYDFLDPDLAKSSNALNWYVFGANFFFNSNTLIQINYTVKQEQGTSIDNNYAAVQFQIGF
jgi:phosphate-selective porin OprO and OprP